MEKLYKLDEAAQMLSLRRLTIYRWVRARKIKAVRLPDGRLRIAESELEKVVEPDEGRDNTRASI